MRAVKAIKHPKSVFIAGSRKFYEDIEELVQTLEESKIRAATAGKWRNTKEDTLEGEKTALLNAFRKIDESDIVYIYSKDGYVGKTVAMEIAYAYAKKKELISSHRIDEYSAQALISRIMAPEKLIKYCKQTTSY